MTFKSVSAQYRVPEDWQTLNEVVNSFGTLTYLTQSVVARRVENTNVIDVFIGGRHALRVAPQWVEWNLGGWPHKSMIVWLRQMLKPHGLTVYTWFASVYIGGNIVHDMDTWCSTKSWAKYDGYDKEIVWPTTDGHPLRHLGSINYIYVVSGVDAKGQRLAPIRTKDARLAESLHPHHGTLWIEHIDTRKRKKIRDI